MQSGLTNNERVGKGLWLLKTGLAPVVDRHFTSRYQSRFTLPELQRIFANGREMADIEAEAQGGKRYFDAMDAAALLKVMANSWNDVFRARFQPRRKDMRKRFARSTQQMGAPATLL